MIPKAAKCAVWILVYIYNLCNKLDIHSIDFNQNLQSTCCVPGTVLEFKLSVVVRTDMVPALSHLGYLQ